MMSIVWHFLGITNPKIGRLLTWGNNPVNKVKLFGSLLGRNEWVPDANDKTEIKQICTVADGLRAKRNRLAHGLWSQRQSEGKKFRLFYMPENENRILPGQKNSPIVTLKELRQWAKEMDTLNARLKRFHTKIGAPIP